MLEPEDFASGGGERPGNGPETTGRFIVVFDDDVTDPGEVLRTAAGLSDVANSRDFADQAVDPSKTGIADATVFTTLGIAVVEADPNQFAALRDAAGTGDRRIQSVSPELVHHALLDTAARTTVAAPRIFQDSTDFTWGLQATQVPTSRFTGLGIKLAVLDTGFDAAHPDFSGRAVTMQSFIAGETAQDGHGHGTHCIGTSSGPKSPAAGPRYGIAFEADILAGKVLSNLGSGTDGGIIAGINWAVANGCAIISMSLGADVPQVHPPYVAAGRRALDLGSLIIAAAGNNADRMNFNYGFVGPPANSPYISAVAALNQQLDMAFFSARSLPVNGGQVDVAGPGWQVYSSWILPTAYRTISGTSMATPHVAGLAALWAQATGYRGRELWATMAQDGRRLREPSFDVGTGLLQAPQ